MKNSEVTALPEEYARAVNGLAKAVGENLGEYY